MSPLSALLLVLLAASLVVSVALLVHVRRQADVIRAVTHELDPEAVGGGFTTGATPGASAGIDRLRALQRAAKHTTERYGALIGDVTQLHQALAAIPQGVVLSDADGRIVYRNAVAAQFEGGRHGDALVEAAIEEVLADAGRGLPGHRTLDLFGPPRRTLVLTSLPLGTDRSDRGRGGALAIVEDVSERRRLEAVRRDFVANISHELRTPIGALGLLAETILGEDDPEVRARLSQRMLAESDRVARTIDDLLTLSRIESEELPEREPVAAGLVIAEAVDRIRPAAEQRDIQVVAHEPSDRLAIFGDRRQIVSALYNLLDNAVKYSDPGSRVEVTATTDGAFVDLAVRDHGIGIPESDVDRIFERFYRVDQARSRQTGGTGLGLAIVRHVATNHQGSVLVESQLGEGSSFTLRLPTASSGPVALDAAEAS
jgi:two-component system sensor histidine kinase SenX3